MTELLGRLHPAWCRAPHDGEHRSPRVAVGAASVQATADGRGVRLHWRGFPPRGRRLTQVEDYLNSPAGAKEATHA